MRRAQPEFDNEKVLRTVRIARWWTVTVCLNDNELTINRCDIGVDQTAMRLCMIFQ